MSSVDSRIISDLGVDPAKMSKVDQESNQIVGSRICCLSGCQTSTYFRTHLQQCSLFFTGLSRSTLTSTRPLVSGASTRRDLTTSTLPTPRAPSESEFRSKKLVPPGQCGPPHDSLRGKTRQLDAWRCPCILGMTHARPIPRSRGEIGHFHAIAGAYHSFSSKTDISPLQRPSVLLPFFPLSTSHTVRLADLESETRA
jgi:hypothetical protein